MNLNFIFLLSLGFWLLTIAIRFILLSSRRHKTKRVQDRQRLREANWRAGDRRR